MPLMICFESKFNVGTTSLITSYGENVPEGFCHLNYRPVKKLSLTPKIGSGLFHRDCQEFGKKKDFFFLIGDGIN